MLSTSNFAWYFKMIFSAVRLYSSSSTSRILESFWKIREEKANESTYSVVCMLRSICGISHPVRSRISNGEVRARAGQRPLTESIMDKQLALFQRAARRPDGDPLRDTIFCPGTMRLVMDKYVRNVGAPHHERARMLWPHARIRFPELFP